MDLGQPLRYQIADVNRTDFKIDNVGNVSIPSGTFGCNEITIADGHGLNLQEDISFTGATTENLINFPDNLANALSFMEGVNPYLTFVSTDGSEAINFGVVGRFLNEGLHVLDTNASHDLIIKAGSDLAADRILSLITGDAARTITLSGNPTLDDWFDQDVKQTANVTFGHLNLRDFGEIRFYDNGNYVGFTAPALDADQIWVLPDADGDANDFLQTDGAGNLTWAPGGAGAATFLALTDTPAGYAGEAGKFVKVNPTPDALIFASLVKADISDTPWAWADVAKADSNLIDLATRQHAGLTDVTSGQHHAQLHAAEHHVGGGDLVNHDSLTGFVAAEHLSLPNTIANVLSDHTKTVHDALGLSHDSLADVSVNDHHAQAHTLASHSTKAHSELSDAPAGAHHPQLHASAHHVAGGDLVNHDSLTGFVAAEHLSLPNTIANVLSNHTLAVHNALSIDHGSLGGRGDDDHSIYYNAARHTVAIHDALNINADRLDTYHHTSFMKLTGGTFSGAVYARDHGTAATDEIVNVCYGTGAPPTASTTTIGTLFIRYTA